MSQAIVLHQGGQTLPVIAGTALPSIYAPNRDTGARTLEFFTARIRNPHTRRAYARAAAGFADWCGRGGIDSLVAITPVHVAAYEIACVGSSTSAGASVVFYSKGDTFVTVAHEATVDNMDTAMDMRDKLINTLTHTEIASR